MSGKIVKAISNPNIAVIKYWGKEDVKSNIPANESLSFSMPKLITETTIEYTDPKDLFIFNGEEADMPERMISMIAFFKKLVNDYEPIKISSSNNFPHSSGLASSASGYSALILALNEFYKTNFSEKDLSILARKCSGSASRSIPKGIVHNVKEFSYSIGDWPEIKIFLILIDSSTKKVSSTQGMLRTQSTSFFYKERLERVNEKIKLCMEYIRSKDFESLAKLIMRESNEIHAVFMESFPPIRYINDKGFSIIERVHEVNENEKYENEVYKTFNDYEIIECN